MKIIIDGKSGNWEVFIDISEQGVYKKVEISECLRVEITTVPKLLTPWVQFVAREHNDVNASSPNEFIDGEPPFISGHEPGQACMGCEICWIKNPKFKGYLSHQNDQG